MTKTTGRGERSRSPGRLLGRILAVVLVVVVSATGCTREAPVDSAPELAGRLARVDAAIVGGQFGEARDAVDALLRATTRALGEGRLDEAEAERIIAAAERLRRELPEDLPEVTAEEPSPAVAENDDEPEESPSKGKDKGKGKGRGK